LEREARKTEQISKKRLAIQKSVEDGQSTLAPMITEGDVEFLATT